MAVNILGQNIQLLLNQTQGADIAKGLQAGEVIQARLTELLPDNRAIIQFKGMNLLAALPPPQAGQAFTKGALLDLAVLQSKSTPPETVNQPKNSPTAAPQTPALSLKLLGINSGATVPLTPLPQSNAPIFLSRPSLESLLTQVKVPINTANLQAAQSLSRHGLSVDKASINFVVQTTDTMIQAESALQQDQPVSATPNQLTTPAAPVPTALLPIKSLLIQLLSQPDHAADKPVIQKIINQLDRLLNQNPNLKVQTPISAPLIRTATQLLNQIETIAAQVKNAPTELPQALPQLEIALNALEATLPTATETPVPNSTVSKVDIATSENLRVPIKREVVAAVIRELTRTVSPEVPIKQTDLLKKIDTFITQVSQPKSDITDKLVSSAKNQLPEPPAFSNVETQSHQGEVLQVLVQIKDSFVKQPLPSPLKSEASLLRAFDSRNLGPIPKTALESLPREAVQDAVVFLKARSLPVTRALVETVATELNKTTDLASTIQNIVAVEPQLSQGVSVMHPHLKEVFENLKQFLNDNGIKPEDKDLAIQIQKFISQSGLSLESNLAKIATPELPASKLNIALNPENSLKAILFKLKDEVTRAEAQPLAQASPEIADKLEHLGNQISSALNSMHTLALSARPTPAFDVTTVQLPIFIGGQMQSGQLSVYWKRGRPHELSAQDPVNVVFLLNTRGLGEVKVQLQVWKNECQCRVTVASDATRDFIKGDSKEFKVGFEKNTRFKLSSLDVATKDPLSAALSLGLSQLPTNFESARVSGSPALNLTA